MGPQRRSHSNPQNLWIFSISWQKKKKNFISVVNLRILRREDYPRLPGCAYCNHKGPYIKERPDGQSQRQELWQMKQFAGQKGHESKNAGQVLGKTRVFLVPWSLQKKQSSDTLILALLRLGSDFWLLDCKINLYWFKPIKFLVNWLQQQYESNAVY